MNNFEREILIKALDNGMIDLANIEAQVAEMEKNKYLGMHKSKIWQGSDGKWYTYLPDASTNSGRRMIKKSLKSDIEEAVIKFYKVDDEKPTFDSVYKIWIESKLKYGEITKETYDRYQCDYARFFEGKKFKHLRFSEITSDTVEVFVKSTIHDMELTAKAWGGLRIILKGTFNYAKRHGFTEISISVALDEMDISKKAFKRVVRDDKLQVFSRSEVVKLESYVAEHMDIQYLGVLLAFQTGLRCGELAALQWSDVYKDAIHVTKTEISYKEPGTKKHVYEIRNSTKGRDGSRYVVLTPDAQKVIQDIRRLNPFGEFVFMVDGERMKAQSFGRAIRKLCTETHITVRSIHKARKTYATNLKNHGVDDKLIQKQMGHADIATTNGYYYFDNRDFDEAKAILSKCVL